MYRIFLCVRIYFIMAVFIAIELILYYNGNEVTKMEITKIAKVLGDQDGVIFGDLLFIFNSKGKCNVFDLTKIDDGEVKEHSPISAFTLDKAELICPHNNAVTFGCEYYEEGDEFPVFYTNIYNNYAGSKNKLKGVCLAYRLEREGDGFKTTLLQMIEIGFTEDEIWKSPGENMDVRPFGNFVADRENNKYYGFVMRDNDRTTRYFTFDMPKVRDGETDENYGIKKVVLSKADIKDYFDTDYHRFIQGASVKDGKIYSVEGFTNDNVNFPALRIIDMEKKKQIEMVDFREFGIHEEAEMIDFYKGEIIYADNPGNLYRIKF